MKHVVESCTKARFDLRYEGQALKYYLMFIGKQLGSVFCPVDVLPILETTQQQDGIYVQISKNFPLWMVQNLLQFKVLGGPKMPTENNPYLFR